MTKGICPDKKGITDEEIGDQCCYPGNGRAYLLGGVCAAAVLQLDT